MPPDKDLPDCDILLETGEYYIVTSGSSDEKYIAPKTRGRLIESEEVISSFGPKSLEVWQDIYFPNQIRKGYHSWVPTDNFILHMRKPILPDNRDDNYVGRFSFEPESGELIPSIISVDHATAIENFGSLSLRYNLYVRGIYVPDKGIIFIKPYFNPVTIEGEFDPYRGYDPKIDARKTNKTLEMLVNNGLPNHLQIITQANNEIIKVYTRWS